MTTTWGNPTLLTATSGGQLREARTSHRLGHHSRRSSAKTSGEDNKLSRTISTTLKVGITMMKS